MLLKTVYTILLSALIMCKYMKKRLSLTKTEACVFTEKRKNILPETLTNEFIIIKNKQKSSLLELLLESQLNRNAHLACTFIK